VEARDWNCNDKKGLATGRKKTKKEEAKD